LHFDQAMLQHDPDVICAQEVDHFDDFAKSLAGGGYAGLFHKKPKSPCLAHCELEDGCALWYKTARLELVSSRVIQYVDPREAKPKALNQGAQIVLLRVRATGQLLVVANTHLKAAKTAKGELIRALQAQQLLDVVAAVKAKAERDHGAGSVPFVIAGDFNASPTDEGTDSCYRTCVEHPLGIRSAYPTTLDHPKLYTTWKIRGASSRGASSHGSLCPHPRPLHLPLSSDRDCPRVTHAPALDESATRNYIDYIFFGGLLVPVGRLALPDAGTIGEDRLPSAAWPSDHLSLLAVFEMP
jgi:nocturnin